MGIVQDVTGIHTPEVSTTDCGAEYVTAAVETPVRKDDAAAETEVLSDVPAADGKKAEADVSAADGVNAKKKGGRPRRQKK